MNFGLTLFAMCKTVNVLSANRKMLVTLWARRIAFEVNCVAIAESVMRVTSSLQPPNLISLWCELIHPSIPGDDEETSWCNAANLASLAHIKRYTCHSHQNASTCGTHEVICSAQETLAVIIIIVRTSQMAVASSDNFVSEMMRRRRETSYWSLLEKKARKAVKRSIWIYLSPNNTHATNVSAIVCLVSFEFSSLCMQPAWLRWCTVCIPSHAVKLDKMYSFECENYSVNLWVIPLAFLWNQKEFFRLVRWLHWQRKLSANFVRSDQPYFLFQNISECYFLPAH